jgi:hypothetical protein
VHNSMLFIPVGYKIFTGDIEGRRVKA